MTRKNAHEAEQRSNTEPTRWIEVGIDPVQHIRTAECEAKRLKERLNLADRIRLCFAWLLIRYQFKMCAVRMVRQYFSQRRLFCEAALHAFPHVEWVTKRRTNDVKENDAECSGRMDESKRGDNADEWQQRELVDERIKPSADPQVKRASDNPSIFHGFCHLPVDDVEATRLNDDEKAVERTYVIECVGANPEDRETPERNPVGR